MQANGKGDARREEDATAVRERWPLPPPPRQQKPRCPHGFLLGFCDQCGVPGQRLP